MHKLDKTTPAAAPLFTMTRPRRHTRLIQALIARTSNTRLSFFTIAARNDRAQSEPLHTSDRDADGDITMGDVPPAPPPPLRRCRSFNTEIPRGNGPKHDIEMERHTESTIPPATTGPQTPAVSGVWDAERYSSAQAAMLSIKRESDVEMGRAVELSVNVEVGSAAGPPSPAATVVCDDEPLPSAPTVKHPPIKVRDFAYPPFRPPPSSPATSTSSLASTIETAATSPCPSPTAVSRSRSVSPSPTSRATSRATSVASFAAEPQYTPATEIFDPLAALAEVDFRFSCAGRARAVPGRSLRRLLDLGWLTPAELVTHALPIDYDSLAAHDSRPYYPWRPIRRGPSPEPGEDASSPPPYDRRTAAGPPPSDAERRARAHQVGPGILMQDRRMAELARDYSRAVREAELLEQMAEMFEANAARKKREQAAAAAFAASSTSRARKPPVHAPPSGGVRVVPARSKRRIDDADGDSVQVGTSQSTARRTRGPHDSKKRRITPEPSRAGTSSQPPLSGGYSPSHGRAYPASQPHAGSSPSPPRVQPRQFPAPAYAYDLQTHPELAARLAQQAGGAGAARSTPNPSAPRAVSVGGVGKGKGKMRAAPLQRVDTQPVDADTEVDTEDEDGGAPLQRRPSAMDVEERPARVPVKRGLGRTRTVAQLIV